DAPAGWLLLEDLGDQTLAECLAQTPTRKTELYQRAVADLARAQLVLDELPTSSIALQRRFDADLLEWELHHFREYGLEARGITMSTEQRARFDAAAAALARQITELPYGFTHRDYQSRN